MIARRCRLGRIDWALLVLGAGLSLALAACGGGKDDVGPLIGLPGSGAAASRVEAGFAYAALLTGSLGQYRIDPATGLLSSAAPAITYGDNVVDVVADPTGKFLYVILQSADQIYGYAINQDSGALATIPGSPFTSDTTAGSPASAFIHPNGGILFVSNLATGSISFYGINQTTGALITNASSPYVISSEQVTFAVTHPTANYIYVGGAATGQVYAFDVDPTTGNLPAFESVQPTAGSLPSHGVVNPTGTVLYYSNGLGTPTVEGQELLGGGATLNPSFTIPVTGLSSALPHPTLPVTYVADSDGGLVRVFNLDASAIPIQPDTESHPVTNPLTMALYPGRNYLYVANQSGNSIESFLVDSATGSLATLQSFPTGSGTLPQSLVIVPLQVLQ